jgi:hypothetical protein
MAHAAPSELPLETASEFAELALGNLVCEFPYQPAHVVSGPSDTATPRQWHPIFFGCFDWHSAVHGYWLLARLRRLFPDLPQRNAIAAHFCEFLTEENVTTEIAYFYRPESYYFERPYGWAWTLMLASELSRHDHTSGRKWRSNLQPLTELIRDRFLEFIVKAHLPNRVGTHHNIAFAIVLALEYAVLYEDLQLKEILVSKARRWFIADRQCQAWEPSLNDFLSPALIEAECMRRILPETEFANWLFQFLPELSKGQPAVLFDPVEPNDRTDGQMAHLDGLNVSRAWCLRGIASTFPADRAARDHLLRTADRHIQHSLPHITGHYAGEHWLATFALLAMTE